MIWKQWRKNLLQGFFAPLQIPSYVFVCVTPQHKYRFKVDHRWLTFQANLSISHFYLYLLETVLNKSNSCWLLLLLFFNLFLTNSQIHDYITRTANNYRIQHCQTNLNKFTIPYQGLKNWTSLPVAIASLSSFPNFEKKKTASSF